jgi:hypothetical protein
MASGSYGQRQPAEVTVLSARQRDKHRVVPWVVGVMVCFGVVFMAKGALSGHPSSSYLTVGGGQTYAVQVGGNLANTWQHDPATIPTPTAQPQATASASQGATPYTVVASPSLPVAFIDQVLSTYHSPAAGKGQSLYDLGKQYGIDPAFALAFFMHESSFGTQGEATKSLSLGNLRCIPNYRCADNFAQFDSWEDGFKAWYQLIRNLYVAQWGLTTVDQIIPKYAPAADHNDEAAYIGSLKHALDVWHAGQIIVK